MEHQQEGAEAEFAADTGAPRHARRWLSEQLEPLGLSPQRMQDALLLVSELVTNVVVHTDSVPKVSVAVTPRRVEIGVADADGRLAAITDESSGQIGGWGLRIVDEVASSWGARFPGAGTKVLWFTIERETDDQSGSRA